MCRLVTIEMPGCLLLWIPSSIFVLDRYVLLGNHRDAWVFGAVDPTSGTVTQIEVTRVLGKIYQNGTELIKIIIQSLLC